MVWEAFGDMDSNVQILWKPTVGLLDIFKYKMMSFFKVIRKFQTYPSDTAVLHQPMNVFQEADAKAESLHSSSSLL